MTKASLAKAFLFIVIVTLQGTAMAASNDTVTTAPGDVAGGVNGTTGDNNAQVNSVCSTGPSVALMILFIVFVTLQGTAMAASNDTVTTAPGDVAGGVNGTTGDNNAQVNSVCSTGPSVALMILAAAPALMAFVRKL